MIFVEKEVSKKGVNVLFASSPHRTGYLSLFVVKVDPTSSKLSL